MVPWAGGRAHVSAVDDGSVCGVEVGDLDAALHDLEAAVDAGDAVGCHHDVHRWAAPSSNHLQEHEV